MGEHGRGKGRDRHGAKLWVLALVPFIMVLGNSMLIPVLPRMMAVMHLTLFQVGLIITVFSVPAGLIIPLAGALSDRVGRKVVMAPALVLYGFGGLGAGFAAWLLPHPYPWIMGFRLAQGIGAGGTYQLAMAVAGDMFTGRGRSRALGLLEAANGTGKVVSPVAGSALALLVWFAPFFVYGLLALPIAAAVWWVLREPARAQSGSLSGYWQGLASTFRRKGGAMALTFLAGSVVLFILFGVLSYLADVLEAVFGVREFARGLLIAIPVAASAATSYATGAWLQGHLRGGAKGVVVGGLALVAAAMVAEPVVVLRSPVWALAVLVGMGLGTGAVLPAVNTLVTSAVTVHQRGAVTSLYGSVRFFGVALGPPAFSLAMQARYPVFWAAAALSALSALAAGLLLREDRLLPEAADPPARRPA
ncbi:putative efflux transporter [Candidatus Hydrogenisulfobacillus filiaventi]|uniref:Putative efflux transporter n=1 Tax=Candidatus Hydrogenisulfobacillus filiaventi TaxID=2707344 RepID=A0A6F8ZI48_9FIRM|nr:putative efflux transporter [Candidatus Hydrogenisulfobacillus filiaventi]